MSPLFSKPDCFRNGLAAWIVLCCGVSGSMAAENGETSLPAEPRAQQETAAEEPAVSFGPEGYFYLGYRWFETDDSLKAGEYLNPRSSGVMGLEYLSCPLPYRYHANAEFLGRHDFYGDVGFAYKDLVLFRDLLVGAHHNLDHYSYPYATEAGLASQERNPADSYYVDFLRNQASLRFKTPDFPFHTFVKHDHVALDGKKQQRMLLGTGAFGGLDLVSASRDVDWRSDAVTLGANSHAGPVEVEYAFDHSLFKPGAGNILYDPYDAAAARLADTYPHHVMPETKSGGNTLKIHSSYAGGVVAAASFSNLYQKNNYSQTESNTWKGAFDLSWIPDPLVGLFLKYRHRNLDMDTPDRVTLTGISNGVVNTYSVREGVSYSKDDFTLSARYKPLRRLTLFATYDFSYLEREDVAAWAALPGKSSIHTMNLAAQARPFDKLQVKASYEYKNHVDPAYNISPDASNELRLTTTYLPTPWLNVYLEYLRVATERDTLRYFNDAVGLVESGAGDSQRDRFLASLTTIVSPQVSMTASWFYQQWEAEQNLAYGRWVGDNSGNVTLPYRDDAVPYSDEANSFALFFHYTPRQDISLDAGATYTLIEGDTGYRDVAGGGFSLSSFSALKATETVFSLEVAKKIASDWEVGLGSYLDLYDDKAYDLLDGEIFTFTLRLKRYF